MYLGRLYNHNNDPGSGGQNPPGQWFSSLRLCGRSGLGQKKTLNTSVVGKIPPMADNRLDVRTRLRAALQGVVGGAHFFKGSPAMGLFATFGWNGKNSSPDDTGFTLSLTGSSTLFPVRCFFDAPGAPTATWIVRCSMRMFAFAATSVGAIRDVARTIVTTVYSHLKIEL